jgi:hypothetical protein
MMLSDLLEMAILSMFVSAFRSSSLEARVELGLRMWGQTLKQETAVEGRFAGLIAPVYRTRLHEGDPRIGRLEKDEKCRIDHDLKIVDSAIRDASESGPRREKTIR